MSEQDLDFDDLFEDDTYQGGDLVARLRKALKAQKRALGERDNELAAIKEENVTLKSGVRARSLEQLLEAKGAKPALAKFMGDTEASEDAVTAWLSENGELFGYKPKEAGSEPEPQAGQQQSSIPGLTPEMEAALAAMTAVQKQEANAAPAPTLSDDKGVEFIKRVGENAKSFEDAENALRAAGILNPMQ